MGTETHGGYRALRKVLEEEKLPPGNERHTKAFKCCEEFLREHFNGFNKLQEVYFTLVVAPRLLFLIKCPMETAPNKVNTGWEKMSKGVEGGLDRMAKMADAPQSAPKKEDWLKVVARD